MSVVQINIEDTKEEKGTVNLPFNFRVIEEKEAKDIAKDLAKGYMKMLSNLI